MAGSAAPAVLRCLAALLVRGRHGALIRAELDDAFAGDIARGLSRMRACWRYVVNVFGSAFSVLREWRPPQMGFTWLDVKLGMRMLAKQPGLTAVSVFALAIGIPVGLMPAHLVNVLEAPFPVPEGDRIRAIRYWNALTSRVQSPTLFEYARLSEALTTFDGLGAARTASFNIEVDGVSGEPVAGALVSGSAFDILRERPVRGRTLSAADEVIGAPSVVVIGYDLWQARLGGDAGVIGRMIRVGGTPHTVVGVMPKGFRFPLFQQAWLPLRERVPGAPDEGAPLAIFGRLAAGVSSDDAQAQVATLGARLAADFPGAYENVRPQVVRSAYLHVGLPGGSIRALPGFHIVQALTILLLVVACTNVGLLVYARTATRASELAVRTALGASRGRIVSQVFAECLVLAVLAAGVGLLILDLLPRLMPPRMALFIPWWMDFGVTPETVAWALCLAVLSAVTAGVMPALSVTGQAVQRNIQRARADRSGVRFGGMTTAFVAADVAIAIVAIGFAMAVSDYLRDVWRGQEESVGFAAEQYLAAQLRLPGNEAVDEPGASERARFMTRVATVQRELVDRLEAEPDVLGVAAADVLPRMEHPTRRFELDGEPAGDERGHSIKVARVDPGFFDVFDKPILAGRGFDESDAREASAVVIVNTAFVSNVLNGRNAIGRRIRYVARNGEESGRWFEIVGVVGALGMDIMATDEKPGLYHALVPGATQPLHLAIHVSGDPGSFTPRLRSIASDINATAVITSTTRLGDVLEGDWYIGGSVVLGGIVLVCILLTLAASAIYAMMSFAVAQRTREIGIRSALGAQPAAIIFTITRRALAQLGLGLLVGLPIAGFLYTALRSAVWTFSSLVIGLAPGVAAVVLIGLFACTAPTLRALRITPTEALRGD